MKDHLPSSGVDLAIVASRLEVQDILQRQQFDLAQMSVAQVLGFPLHMRFQYPVDRFLHSLLIKGFGDKVQHANLEGFKGRVTRDDWVGQAKLLASGQGTEFSKRVDKGDVY